jgi:hypothetical protein
MSQISPPIRIVLAASLCFMAAWFVLLRPGTEPVAPTQPAAAPGSGFGTAVKGAKDATAATNARSAAVAAEGGATAASKPGTTAATGGKAAPAAAAKTKPADKALGLPVPVAKAVAQKKTLVMLFWNKRAYDDQAVRRELRGINRHNGKVQVHVASIEDVARYAPITRGVNLEQSPTVVVVKGGTADALVGYVDRGTINQTVSDVMRSGTAKKAKKK